VTLNFAEVEVEYEKQKDDGSGQKAGNLTWNIEKNIS
jgi:hypothetical protein